MYIAKQTDRYRKHLVVTSGRVKREEQERGVRLSTFIPCIHLYHV